MKMKRRRREKSMDTRKGGRDEAEDVDLQFMFQVDVVVYKYGMCRDLYAFPPRHSSDLFSMFLRNSV